MLEFRLLNDDDIALIEKWLHKKHVRRWYEIPHLGVSIDDWIYEIKERNGEYKCLTHLLVLYEEQPIGLCQYYKCKDSDEDFGTLPIDNTYGINYLIGEESCIGKGVGKEMLSQLLEKIFSYPDAERITADIDKDNKASENTLLSCGFTLSDAKNSRYVLHRKST